MYWSVEENNPKQCAANRDCTPPTSPYTLAYRTVVTLQIASQKLSGVLMAWKDIPAFGMDSAAGSSDQTLKLKENNI